MYTLQGAFFPHRFLWYFSIGTPVLLTHIHFKPALTCVTDFCSFPTYWTCELNRSKVGQPTKQSVIFLLSNTKVNLTSTVALNKEDARSPVSIGLEQAIISPMHLSPHLQRFKQSFSFSSLSSNFHPEVMRNHFILRKNQQQIYGQLPSERLLCLVSWDKFLISLFHFCCFQPTSSSATVLLRLNMGFCSSHPLTLCTCICSSFLLFVLSSLLTDHLTLPTPYKVNQKPLMVSRSLRCMQRKWRDL